MPQPDRRRLGQTDFEVSSLCLGTMMYGDQIDADAAYRQMDRCLEGGITFFDTAEMYTIPPKPSTQGNSERIVGDWMAARGCRDRIELATKVVGRSDTTHYRNGAPARVTPEQIRGAIEGSLSRLKTDYIDLYQIHWPDRSVPMFGGDLRGYTIDDPEDVTPIEDQLDALTPYVESGTIRAIGLSNETPWGVTEFLRHARERGLPRVASVQNAYSLINRQFEYGLAEVAMREDVGLLAYSPLGQGSLSGKYLNGALPPDSRWATVARFTRYETVNAEPAIAAYVALARDHGLDPAAMALQFVTSRPWTTSNIFGARTDEQLDAVFASLAIDWTDELNSAVNDIHVRYPNPCP